MTKAARTSAIDIQERFCEWTRGAAPGPALCLDRDYYLGRLTESDVNSKTLEQIYIGLAADVGREAAKNFVRLVDSIEDMHTSLFIDAFVAFWRSGCKLTRLEQRTADRDEPMFSTGRAAEAQLLSLLARDMTGGKPDNDRVSAHTQRVKDPFLTRHQRER